MKKLYIFLLSFFLISLIYQKDSISQPIMGADITWECVPSGQLDSGKYIFQLRVYALCNYNVPIIQNITSNSPVSTINLYLVNGWPKTVKPECNSNTSFPHLICNSVQNLINGVVIERLYRSQAVYLNGIPPTTGWSFNWFSAIRTPSTNTDSLSNIILSAIMYPYSNRNTYPCFDNSPAYAEIPTTAICTGYPSSINYYTNDKDLDSLDFSWGIPKINSASYLNYQPGYSYQSPLPSPSQDSNNTAAYLNSETGKISFTSHTTGSFLTSIKTTSYKEGQKVSEIWREFQVLLEDCGTNPLPIIYIVLQDGTPVSDTIVAYAGDSICFIVNGYSTQLLPNGMFETIKLKAKGLQFGDYIPANGNSQPKYSKQLGCPNPPCASLLPAPSPDNPLSNIVTVQTRFSWQTNCGHLNADTLKNALSNIYRFSFIAQNDYCPIPTMQTTDIIIKLIPKAISKLTMRYINYNYTIMTVDFGWKKFLDVDSNFISYDIYYSPTYGGPYTLIDSIQNRNQIVYSHNIGNATKAYYYMQLRAYACNKRGFSENSDTLYIDVTSIENTNKQTQFELFQNEPNPTNGKTVIRYSIDKQAKGKFQLLDFTGRIVFSQDIQSDYGTNEITLETSQFSKGIYYYRVDFGELSGIRKLIVL